ncbi:MAG: hypothetical protein Q7J85_05485 [Bacillota bacterium]|nr:hypothetical protein [Bacillota bacterium]
MILDKQLILSDGQAITATAASENSIDLGAANLDIGQGNPVFLEVWLDTAFDTSVNTLTITLQDGATVGALADIMTIMPARATSLLLAANRGLLVKFSLPEGLKRHIGLNYTVSVGLTSGKLNAFLTIG